VITLVVGLDPGFPVREWRRSRGDSARTAHSDPSAAARCGGRVVDRTGGVEAHDAAPRLDLSHGVASTNASPDATKVREQASFTITTIAHRSHANDTHRVGTDGHRRAGEKIQQFQTRITTIDVRSC